MANPEPCQDCRTLVARKKKQESRHDTLERVRGKPDIGQPLPDIGHEAEYQCVVCEFTLTRSMDKTSFGWRLGK
jgi:hypothetical protein